MTSGGMQNIMLTIGIPTFNRRKVVVENLQSLMNRGVQNKHKILVIDNASPDNTYDTLKQNFGGVGIEILRNQSNLGIAGNFVELITQCRTEYLLVISDEDQLSVNNLDELVAFLRVVQPLFVSTQFYYDTGSGERLYRGCNKARVIRPKEFWSSSFYISGLVFNVQKARISLEGLAEFLKNPSNIYPQVMLSADLMMEGTSYFWNKPISSKKYQLPTYIESEGHKKYYHVCARWEQYKAFESFLEKRVKNSENAVNNKKKAIAIEMLNAHNRRLFYTIIGAAESELPGSKKVLIDSALRYVTSAVLKKPFRLLRSFFRRHSVKNR